MTLIFRRGHTRLLGKHFLMLLLALLAAIRKHDNPVSFEIVDKELLLLLKRHFHDIVAFRIATAALHEISGQFAPPHSHMLPGRVH